MLAAKARARNLSFCSAFLLSLLGVVPGCSSQPESERAVATRVLAEYVAKVSPPKSVLVISNPFTQQSGRPAEIYAFEKAGIEGLKEGFGKAPVTVAFPKLKEEAQREPGSVAMDSQTKTPLSFMVAENSFSELIQQNPSCDVVVTLIGLPVNLAGLKEWSQEGGPKFALLLVDWRMIGGREAILQAFQSKKVVAAVASKPDATEPVGGDYKEQFDSRFLLVTNENVESLMKEYPAVFGL